MKYYTGIGSRETPNNILEIFTTIAGFLSKNNYILRSGRAKNADISFEIGCDKINGKKEIFLPWKGFGDSDSLLIVHDIKAYEIASQFHPAWNKLSQGAKKLQARNTHQVLGWDLKTPSKFILCWTVNGSGKGGTGQALRIAEYFNIPIFDAGKYKEIDICKGKLKDFLEDNI
jgi:hypothetical protein